MYRVARILLMITAVAMIFDAAMLFVLCWPASLFGAALIWFGTIRRGRRFTALGSARWASARELRRGGMLDGKSGLILGRLVMDGKEA